MTGMKIERFITRSFIHSFSCLWANFIGFLFLFFFLARHLSTLHAAHKTAIPLFFGPIQIDFFSAISITNFIMTDFFMYFCSRSYTHTTFESYLTFCVEQSIQFIFSLVIIFFFRCWCWCCLDYVTLSYVFVCRVNGKLRVSNWMTKWKNLSWIFY